MTCTVPRNDVLERGQGNLAVALHGVAVSHGEQRARNMHGQVECGSGDELLVVEISGVGPGGPLDMRPTSGFGATPIEPKNGASFKLTPGANSAVPARTLKRTSLKPAYGKSSGSVPLLGMTR